MINKKIKASGILFAGSALLASTLLLTPSTVSADANICTGTARYYFDDKEVVSWLGEGAKVFSSDYNHFYRDSSGNVQTSTLTAGDANSKNGKLTNKNGVELNMTDSTGHIDFFWSTTFPGINKDGDKPGVNITGNSTKQNDATQISKWLDLVAESSNEDMSKGKDIPDDKDSNLTHYLHGSWTSDNTTDTAVYANTGLENPVYQAGILRGIKAYKNDHDNAGDLYNTFKDEVIKSAISATPSNPSYSDMAYSNDSATASSYNFTIHRTYTAPINTDNAIDYSYWGIFQHYDSSIHAFKNPVTGEAFADNSGETGGDDYSELNNEDNYTGSKPTLDVAKLYTKWVYDHDTYSSSGSDISCSSGNCIIDGYTAYNIENYSNPIWTPGTATWINNFVIYDRNYKYDCTPAAAEEPPEKQPRSGIPSYGYLAIILAGAAGVYVLARKRNKFIKF